MPRMARVVRTAMARRNQRKTRQFTPLAERVLSEHSFPGNVRELRNAVEHAVIRNRDGRVDLDDLPAAVVNSGHLRLLAKPAEVPGVAVVSQEASEEVRPIVQALRGCQGNVLRASQTLGIDRRQFYRLLRRHGIDPGSY